MLNEYCYKAGDISYRTGVVITSIVVFPIVANLYIACAVVVLVGGALSGTTEYIITGDTEYTSGAFNKLCH